jgi:hypothetical protein
MFCVFIHLLCDIVGSGYDWPIYPWWPFSSAPFSVSWSYEVSSLPNILAGFIFTFLAYFVMKKTERSPFEMLSTKMDEVFVRGVLKKEVEVEGEAG